MDEQYKEVLREWGFRFDDDDSDPESPIVVVDESFHTNLQRAIGLPGSSPSQDVPALIRKSTLPDELKLTILSYVMTQGQAAKAACKANDIEYKSKAFRKSKSKFDSDHMGRNVTLSPDGKTATYDKGGAYATATVLTSRWVPLNGHATFTVRVDSVGETNQLQIGVVSRGFETDGFALDDTITGLRPFPHCLAWYLCYSSSGCVYHQEENGELYNTQVDLSDGTGWECGTGPNLTEGSELKITIGGGTIVFEINGSTYNVPYPEHFNGDIALAVSLNNGDEVTLK
jgi:hypothetical protein